ncbi:hypothetical protein H3143_02690 [Mycoplasma tullyi]|uniref:DUF31 domain-containing protein n=1 Tax=Mycoplasma tullyi TaxID=1612150 RepID=A0A7D7UDC0_9MOLU|nr:lipoprotein 17-related variable surface protein [Mycoplasma tullyi]QMT98386.1 hypothetical protein H3143_02690 [Mycoplasma tullyi]
MVRKTTWLKLFCLLSGLSVISSSCFNPESFFTSKKNADDINVNNITSNDLAVNDKLNHKDLLASNITSSNFSKYFGLKLIQKADEKIDPNDLVNFKVGGFSADDSNGILSFIVTVERKNSSPIEFKQVSLEINGFLKKKIEREPSQESSSPNSETGEPNDSQASNNEHTDQPVIIHPGESTTETEPTPPSTTVDKDKQPEPSSSSTKLKIFSDQEIYKKIYDRSFSIGFYTRHWLRDPSDPNLPYKQLLYLSNGTGWLLDYQISPQNPDLYRLFIATNLHVAEGLWNRDDYDHPVLDSDIRLKPDTIGFSLGKSEQVNFGPQDSRFSNSSVKYVTYLSNNLFFNSSPNRSSALRVNNQRLSIPETVFTAVDFVNDQQTKNEFSDYWAQQFKGQFVNNRLGDKNLLNSSFPKDPQSRMKIADGYINKGIGLYKDFAVLSFVVNISQKRLTNEPVRSFSSAQTLRKYVLEAVNELNESSKIAKLPGQLNLTNQDVPYVDLDYPSVEANHPNALSIQEIDKAYIAGYPGVGQPGNSRAFSNRWVQNNLNPNPNYQLEPNIKAELVDRYQDLTGLIQSYHNKYYHQYGITQAVLRSSLKPGSSGSVVYSKYGLPFGIFWGGYSGRGDDGTGVFDYLANDTRKQVTVNVRFGSSRTPRQFKINIEPYNLIDGTNKEKYPNQTNSYRQALPGYLEWADDNRFSKDSTFLFSHP